MVIIVYFYTVVDSVASQYTRPFKASYRLMAAIQDLKDSSLLVDRLFIGGNWVLADDGATMAVFNPATGEPIGMVPTAGRPEADRAIDSAANALPGWRLKTAGARADILENWHALILANVEDLARIMTAEQGKPLAEAESEIRYAASFVKWFAEEGRRIRGYTIPAPGTDHRIQVMREPVGVCAAITPWNFPAAMITRKCAPAIAAGCTIIVKPSELTPYTALALARLAERAGMPPGVFNVVFGAPQEIGAAITESPIVRKLSFTGSTQVGAMLMRQCAGTIKKVSLELGGNAPFIVFDDANVDLAVQGAMASKFRNAGQTCVCANRLLIQSGIHDEFVGRLGEAVAAMKVGNGAAPGVVIGPLINEAASIKVAAHIADALQNGATIAAQAVVEGDNAHFIAPTVLTGATSAMRLAHEETFGPVAAIFRFETEQEALAMANDTPFGLASYFYTDDLHRAWRVAEQLEYGMIGLNTGNLSMEMAPFGGMKQSGLGREGGQEGIDEYLETKAFHWGGLRPS